MKTEAYKWGFEIEFFSPHSEGYIETKMIDAGFAIYRAGLPTPLRMTRIDYKLQKFWKVDSDATVKPGLSKTSEELDDNKTFNPQSNLEECEVSSPVFPLTRRPPEVAFRLLKFLRDIEGEVNRSCGLHFHVSGPERLIARHLMDQLRRLSDLSHIYRSKRYCNFGSAQKYGKHTVVNQRARNHVEFRCFNGTLNSHGFAHAYRLVRSTLLTVMAKRKGVINPSEVADDDDDLD